MGSPTENQDVAGLHKTPTGIEGFDSITRGGLPRNRTTLLLGGPGSGKTVFALQTLVNGARQFGEPGIFVAFEENSRQILINAATFGWKLPELEKKQLLFIDAKMRPDVTKAGEFDLSGMLAGIKAEADARGARRIVFDSIDVLLTLLDDRFAERREIYRLDDWISESGLTGIITAKSQGDDPFVAEGYGFMQFMTDCVVALKLRLVDQIALRYVQVMKYRGSGFAENEVPCVIGASGIEVADISATTVAPEASPGRVSSGVERLDAMLGGGYFRGSSVLITGSAGTGKSILAGAFAEAACLRKERTLYVSFDENPSEVVRDLSSVGIRLGPHVKSGVLRMHSARAEASSAEVYLMKIKRIVREHQTRCMVVDPLSAIVKAGGALTAGRVAERLFCLAKSEGITLVSTSLMQGAQSLSEDTPVQISTIADTWIHLTKISQVGERNRALSIVKSRGTKHSNQVRELILGDQGIALADVYTAGGDVLMGTARWQKEAAEQAEHERILAEVERKRREVASARVELGARIEALEQELKQKQAEAERSIGAEARRKLDVAKRRKELEQSPSAKILKNGPENSQAAGKKTTVGRRSPKAGGQ
jgi:circadian clock protein KaiC